MTIFIKKVVNHIFATFFHDTLPELRPTFKFKLLIVSLMVILGVIAITTLLYYH